MSTQRRTTRHAMRHTTRRRVSPRLLDVGASAVLLVAVALWFWPTSTRGPVGAVDASGNGGSASTVAQAEDPPAPSVVPVSADSQVGQVVAGNIFSATRRAPTTAFVMPGQRAAAEVAAMAGVMAGVMDGNAGADSAEVLPRLTGIVSVGGERRALLQLVADVAPRLYRVGETDAGYRIVSIETDRVVLSGRRGARTVHLAPKSAPPVSPSVPDSLEKLPC